MGTGLYAWCLRVLVYKWMVSVAIGNLSQQFCFCYLTARIMNPRYSLPALMQCSYSLRSEDFIYCIPNGNYNQRVYSQVDKISYLYLKSSIYWMLAMFIMCNMTVTKSEEHDHWFGQSYSFFSFHLLKLDWSQIVHDNLLVEMKLECSQR